MAAITTLTVERMFVIGLISQSTVNLVTPQCGSGHGLKALGAPGGVEEPSALLLKVIGDMTGYQVPQDGRLGRMSHSGQVCKSPLTETPVRNVR